MLLDKINNIKLGSLTDSSLKEMSADIKNQVRRGVSPDHLLAEAFSLVREVSRRVLGIRPFDEQVMAGIALHRGKMVEMQTGEGKTLAAVMPAYLNALPGKDATRYGDYLDRFIEEQNDKIKEIHVSGFVDHMGRMPIRESNQEYLLDRVKQINVPFVIEGLFSPGDFQGIRKEIELVNCTLLS